MKKMIKKAQNGGSTAGDSTAYKKTLSNLTGQGLDFEIGKLSKMVTSKSAPSIIQQKIDILKREKSKRSQPKTTIKKAQNGAKADSLMNESNSKKAFANQQEKFGKAAIKSGNGDKTRLIDLKGTTTPTGQGRLDIAKKARKEATKDSIASVKARKMKNGGSLKPVAANQKGLAKLPTAVRNKMGYAKNGAATKMKMGGMCGMKAGGKIKSKK